MKIEDLTGRLIWRLRGLTACMNRRSLLSLILVGLLFIVASTLVLLRPATGTLLYRSSQGLRTPTGTLTRSLERTRTSSSSVLLSSSIHTTPTTMSAKEQVNKYIQDNDVMVFSKSVSCHHQLGFQRIGQHWN